MFCLPEWPGWRVVFVDSDALTQNCCPNNSLSWGEINDRELPYYDVLILIFVTFHTADVNIILYAFINHKFTTYRKITDEQESCHKYENRKKECYLRSTYNTK